MSAFANPDPTFGHQADRVFAFYQLAADVRDRHAYGAVDARRVCLNSIMMAANASVATLRLLNWAKQGGDAALIQGLGLLRAEYINPVAEDLLRATRVHLLVESQFQTEALFRAILAVLRAPQPKGFYKLAGAVLAASGAPDQARSLSLLNVPALIRNSLHANGIHHSFKGQNTVEVIDGVEFRFEDGRPVECGSWYHITVALSASVRVVDAVLQAPLVAGIADIPDAYAAYRQP